MGDDNTETVTSISPLDVAFLCHETNRAYCQVLGDDSQNPWAEAPEWQRESALKGVEFHLANPDAGPEASHESWLEEKRRTGWTYGPIKDEAKKEHHCMVPFDQLPAAQQVKDRLFKGVIDALRPLIDPNFSRASFE